MARHLGRCKQSILELSKLPLTWARRCSAILRTFLMRTLLKTRRSAGEMYMILATFARAGVAANIEVLVAGVRLVSFSVDL